MRKGVAATLAVVGVVACVAVVALTWAPKSTALYTDSIVEDKEFLAYCAKYGKSYATKEEYELRKQIYEESMIKVTMNNQRNDVTYSLGLNRFSDMTHDEYKRMLGFKPVPASLKAVERRIL